MPMFTAALPTAATRGKQPQRPTALMEEEGVEYYTARKRDGALIPAATWPDFGSILLSEISQSQKDRYSVIPCIGATESDYK